MLFNNAFNRLPGLELLPHHRPGITFHIPHAQGNPLSGFVNFLNGHLDNIAGRHHVFGFQNALSITHFTDVNKPLYTRFNLHKSPELRTTGHLSLRHITLFKPFRDRIPGVVNGLFDGKGDLHLIRFFRGRHPDHFNRYRVAHGKHVRRIFHARPPQFGNMNQPFHPRDELHKSAKRHELGHPAHQFITHNKVLVKTFPSFFNGLAQQLSSRKHNIAAVFFKIRNQEFKALPHIIFRLFNITDVHLADGAKCPFLPQ